MKKDKTKRKTKLKLRKWVYVVILFFFLGVMIYSAFNVILWYNDSKTNEKLSEVIIKSTEIKEQKDNENTTIIENSNINDNDYFNYIKMPLIEVDFSDLKKKNSDTIAWIQVMGTNINYPVVQSSNNETYLTKAFDGSENEARWVFMDYRNNVDDFDTNTIIYAHSRVNGTMFGSLKNILTSNWYTNKDNYIIKLSTEKENTLWQVFSVYTILKESYYITTDFENIYDYEKFLTTIKSRSEADFNAEVVKSDKVLTLSTCKDNYGNRIVMHARLIKKQTRT